MAAVARDGFEEVALLLGERSAEILCEQEIGEPDDAVEWSAELVRDVGQEQILGLHHGIEIRVELLQALGGLADFHGEASGVVMRRATLARNREIGRRLIERGPLVRVELRAGYDA